MTEGHYHEHAPLGTEARKVTETDDAWTIPDSVLTRAGVVNGWLRTWKEALTPYARLWEGAPIAYPHPASGVLKPEDLDTVGGQVRNVRLDDKEERLVVDYVFYKRGTPGFRLSAKARAYNEETVRRFLAGDKLESSPGYSARQTPEHGTLAGAEYHVRMHDWVPDHLAVLGIGEDQGRGGCNWNMQCGVGRAQEHDRNPPAPQGRGSPQGDPNMPECGTECATRKTRLEAHESSLKELGGLLEVKGEANCTSIVQRARELTQEYDRLLAHEGVEKQRLAKEAADAKAALNADLKGKEADLAKELQKLDLEALREVHGAYAAARLAREGKVRSDGARPAGGNGNGNAQEQDLIDVYDKPSKTWKQVPRSPQAVQ